MVTVSKRLVFRHLKEPRVKKMFELLENDIEVQSYLQMGNLMVVKRMYYNDHGPVHARICTGSAMELFKLLTNRIDPTTITQGITDMEGAKLIVLCGSYLHDLGNCIHRFQHSLHSCYLASPILDRLLSKLYPRNPGQVISLKCEILHTIYSHEEEIPCLSIEAGVAKVADGTDMAEGRARIPYRNGKTDIHSISALSILKVELEEGCVKAVKIKVNMSNPAGVFQVEEVVGKKLRTSGIQDHIELEAFQEGKKIRTVFSD
jgi:metal-dependent HD superfamily phosphatase/phosphodiesterase